MLDAVEKARCVLGGRPENGHPLSSSEVTVERRSSETGEIPKSRCHLLHGIPQ